MKFKLKGSKNLLKIVLALGISVSLWNCEKEDYEVTTTNPHASHEEFHNPFEKVQYSQLSSDSDFSETFTLLEKHSSNLILTKQSQRGKGSSEKKIKLSIVQSQVIKIEKNNSISWTFELDKRLLKNSDYENFVVKKYNNEFSYHLIAYFDTKNNSKEEKGKSFSFEIPKEKLDLTNVSIQARGDVFDWASPDDGGGGIDTSDPCEGIWIQEYAPCNMGGNADGHAPVKQYDGTYCSGSGFIGYVIDFSHCETGTYDAPSGPGHDTSDPNDPNTSTGGGGGSSSDISNSPSDSGSEEGETLVTSPIPPDEDGKCGEGFIKNPVTGECESICKGGKVYDPTTKNCNCPDGKTEDKYGNCVDKPCKGIPIFGSIEIASQKGLSGTQGAMFGNSNIGGCKRYGSNDCSTPRNRKHDGIDIKNNYGSPIFAMYDGIIYSTKHDKEGAGYNTRIQSTINGKTILISYFHLQKENRVLATSSPVTKVKAGDIIGYQGDSGNLKNALKANSVDSHVHIEVRVHNGSSSWAYKNFELVDPRDYLNVKINDDGTVENNINCN
ncbi:M23 family metallopeptidase [Tenacibaculum sp. MEBiC06402]|uniref:M23 family metallopeptidase n=1 Tax=unclassified Tenacibaculum TaxID=2635139 RepID=UPI003B9C602C